MKFREHKGSLADSMATVVEVDGRAGLVRHIKDEMSVFGEAQIPDNAVHVDPYFGDDDRIGWKNVGIVTLDGYGVFGFVENWDKF